MFRRFCRWKHSLSTTLVAGALVSTAVSYLVPYGTWAADFWLGLAGGFTAAAIVVWASKFTWEEGSDPTRPPD